MMETLKHLSYEERLRNKRRLRASYQCVTKYLEGCKEDGDRLFSVEPGNRTKSNGHKLYHLHEALISVPAWPWTPFPTTGCRMQQGCHEASRQLGLVQLVAGPFLLRPAPCPARAVLPSRACPQKHSAAPTLILQPT